MIQVKRFAGILNKDDKESDLLSVQHRSARNIRFTGGASGLTAENIKGNVIVSNSLPSGTNECIGAFFDQVKQRIIWFNYNSNGNNGIYSYSVQSETVTKIFLCGTDSATDILNFSLDYPVHSASIVYREQSDGDLIYWTDGYNRPKYLNIDTVSSLAPFTSDMINAAKNAPLEPPTTSYGDDADVPANNLRKKMFRFRYRWVYENGEKSTFSPISKIPLPDDGYNPTIDNDPTKNNYISVVVTAGGDDYKAIEIAAQNNINNAWSDFYLVDSLGRDEYSILPDATYSYRFYNDGVYSGIATDETDLYFSYLPDKANTLELLNGNVIIYGGVTDGYDKIERGDIDVSVTVSNGNPDTPYITYSYTADASIILTIGDTVTPGTIYHVEFDYDYDPPTGYNKNVNYTALPGDDKGDVAYGLSLLLSGGNISCSIPSPGVLFVQVATGTGRSITNVVVSTSASGSSVASEAWKWNCPGRLGLIYFDERGKTNGVISFVGDSSDTTDFSFTTPDFSVATTIPQVPIVAASINHTPPAWAVAYQWVRADLKPNFLYWVTNDYQTDTDYLYICIQNLIYQGVQNTGFVPSYEFKEGDRVRIVAQYTGGNFVPYDKQLDIEIVGVVTDRTMTSPASPGTFLKVAKPTVFPVLPYQSQMLIEIYTPKQRSANEQEIFYEWGEKYEIYETVDTKILTYTLVSGTFQEGEEITQSGGGGATGIIQSASPTHITVYQQTGTFAAGYTITGTSSAATGVITNVANGATSRYHTGQTANQTAVQPATFRFTDGDVYYFGRTFYTQASGTTTANEFFIDANYNDYFPSKVTSNGRGWVIEENAAQIYNQVLVRWGGKYQAGTSINQLNIFRPNDFDEVDRSKGDIRRFKVRDRILRVFQDRGVGQYGIYARFIQNNQGVSDLVTTNEIITSNNIQYYQGTFGLCGYPTNLCSNPIADYFTDIVTGRSVRLSGDGLTDLGMLYKGQYYFPAVVTKYNKEITRSNGSKAKVMAFFDTLDGDFHVILQPGSGGGVTAEGSHFSFNEPRNGYNNDTYDYIPEWAICANDVIFTWKDGDLWVHNSGTYCNFYGVQYNAEISFVFNENLLTKKSWNSISELANDIWACPEIYTNTLSHTNQRQESSITSAEFAILEGMPSSSIKRDENSRGGKWNGDFMKGNWMAVKFQKINASNLITLGEISVRFTDSPKTDK